MASPEATARAYARIRYRLLVADRLLGLAVLAAVQGLGCSLALAEWWARVTTSSPLSSLGYLVCLGALSYLAAFPIRFHASYRIERRFDLSRMTLRGWSRREAKRAAVSVLLGAGLIEGLYALLRRAPETWPLWATLGWVVVTVVLTRTLPTVLLPLFYLVTPLEAGEVVTRLLRLCQRAGLPAIGVYRVALGAETRKANAALVGLGRTRRVLVSDTLLTACSPAEIEGVLAHELAHHRHHHIGQRLLVSAVGSWLAFTLTKAVSPSWIAPLGLRGLADIAGLPMLALWLSALVGCATPLRNALSRRLERQADRTAIRLTSEPRAFASALRRLAELNLSDPAPPRWAVWCFYDHPPIAQRIQAADGALFDVAPAACYSGARG